MLRILTKGRAPLNHFASILKNQCRYHPTALEQWLLIWGKPREIVEELNGLLRLGAWHALTQNFDDDLPLNIATTIHKVNTCLASKMAISLDIRIANKV